ncbi:MAG TPA: hypothetical protein VFI27_07630 [candidate division Zixibacteria bacterium]|nr:hypothetical protein [candidate division Zixibacteria bacterium]
MNSTRRCSGRRADGKPCRGYALRSSDPPLCYAHARIAQSQNEEESSSPGAGFYSRCYTLEEIADMVALALDDSLEDELAATRIAVRRVMQQLHEELSVDEYAHMAGIIFRGTNTVARLLRINKALSKENDSEIATGIGEALDLIGPEYDLEL